MRGQGPLRTMQVVMGVRAPGDASRGEGPMNFPYGPPQYGHGGKRFHAHASRVAPFDSPRHFDVYGDERVGDRATATIDLDSLNREGLRALAKERGLKGYGKMTVPALREALR